MNPVQTVKEKIKPKLVDNWREFWRLWSVRLGAVGTALAGWFVMSPETAIHVWLMLPADLKAALPPQFVGYFGIGLFVLSMVAKLFKQKNLPSNTNV